MPSEQEYITVFEALRFRYNSFFRGNFFLCIMLSGPYVSSALFSLLLLFILHHLCSYSFNIKETISLYIIVTIVTIVAGEIIYKKIFKFRIYYNIDKHKGLSYLTSYDSNRKNSNYIILSITYPAILTSSFKFLYRRLSAYVYFLYIIKKKPIIALFFVFPELIWFVLCIFFIHSYPLYIIYINLFLIPYFIFKIYSLLRQYLYRFFNLYQLLLAIENINLNLGDEFEYFLNAITTHGYEYLFKSLIEKLKMFLPI